MAAWGKVKSAPGGIVLGPVLGHALGQSGPASHSHSHATPEEPGGRNGAGFAGKEGEGGPAVIHKPAEPPPPPPFRVGVRLPPAALTLIPPAHSPPTRAHWNTHGDGQNSLPPSVPAFDPQQLQQLQQHRRRQRNHSNDSPDRRLHIIPTQFQRTWENLEQSRDHYSH